MKVLINLFGSTVQCLSSNKPTGFAIMLACVVDISAVTLWAFRRRGWV